ncbi:MAG: hypothetical protein Q4D06_07085 [Coriobacteriia bacterium]|nr:hypothetical protein [Coriobacteriia bacterium]
MQSIKKRLTWLVATVCAVVMLACTASFAWADEAAFMTLYLKDSNTGNVTPVKTYSQQEFSELAAPITASAMNSTMQVYTTNVAVTFEDLFADAGLDVADTDTVYAAAAYGTDAEFGLGIDWTWADMKAGQFYPDASAGNYVATNAVPVVPCLGLNNASSAKNYEGTAGAVEAANLATLATDPSTGVSSAPRLFLGISAQNFTADKASDPNIQGGKRCISGVNAIVVTKDLYMSVYAQSPLEAPSLVKSYTKAEFEALATPTIASAMNGLAQLYTTNKAVTFEDLFADAGVDVADADGVYAAAAYGSSAEFGLGIDWSWGAMKAGQFYPNAAAGSYDATGAVPVVPCLGLNYATSKDYTGTAGAAEQQNLSTLFNDPTTGVTSAPRLFLGIAQDKFTADYADDKNIQGGKRCISGVNAVVVNLRSAALPAAKKLTYNGKTQTGVEADAAYAVTGGAKKTAGTYKATCTLNQGFVWADGTTEPKVVTWKIAKASQKATAAKSTVTKTYAAAKSGKYRGKVKTTKTITSLAKTFGLKSVTAKSYKVTSYAKSATAKKYITVTKSGKVYVKKGLKKGTYTVTIKVTAGSSTNWNSATKTVKLKVCVK